MPMVPVVYASPFGCFLVDEITTLLEIIISVYSEVHIFLTLNAGHGGEAVNKRSLCGCRVPYLTCLGLYCIDITIAWDIAI